MFREMRRKKQLLPEREAEEILRRGKTGVLGVAGDGGYPYAVPLNYVYEDGTIYFHCAKTGHKLDAIRRNGKVSFCVVDQDKVVPEQFTTHYKSAIAFGKAAVLTGDGAKRAAIELLVRKYAPDRREQGEEAIEREWDALCVVAVSVEHLTGKAARGLAGGT